MKTFNSRVSTSLQVGFVPGKYSNEKALAVVAEKTKEKWRLPTLSEAKDIRHLDEFHSEIKSGFIWTSDNIDVLIAVVSVSSIKTVKPNEPQGLILVRVEPKEEEAEKE